MIGLLQFVSGETAALSDDGVWGSAVPGLADHLNRSHSPRDDGPADGQFGRRRVTDAAVALGCGYTLSPSPAELATDDGSPPVY